MYLDEKRQDTSIPPTILPMITGPTLAPEPGLFSPTTITFTLPLTETITRNGLPPSILTTMTLSVLTTNVPAQDIIASTSQSTTTFASSTAPTQVQTSSPAQPSSSSSNGIPLRLIPAIVIPIVLVALVSPVLLYFFLTRHDRKRRKSRISSRIKSGPYPGLATEAKRPTVGHSRSQIHTSNAPDLMNFNIGPAVEKSLPMVNIIQAPEDIFVRPGMWEDHRGSGTPIGRAITRYSLASDTSGDAVDALPNRASMQELSEENLRIARLANDSNASFRVPELDRVSAISAPEDRTTCHGRTGGEDEFSEVSSICTNESADNIDDGVGILSNHEARRSGPLR